MRSDRRNGLQIARLCTACALVFWSARGVRERAICEPLWQRTVEQHASSTKAAARQRSAPKHHASSTKQHASSTEAAPKQFLDSTQAAPT
eukprot:4190348-Lingulodinium_polyedra.AAC.1